MREGERDIEMISETPIHRGTPEEGDQEFTKGMIVALPNDVADKWIELGWAKEYEGPKPAEGY